MASSCVVLDWTSEHIAVCTWFPGVCLTPATGYLKLQGCVCVFAGNTAPELQNKEWSSLCRARLAKSPGSWCCKTALEIRELKTVRLSCQCFCSNRPVDRSVYILDLSTSLIRSGKPSTERKKVSTWRKCGFWCDKMWKIKEGEAWTCVLYKTTGMMMLLSRHGSQEQSFSTEVLI